MSPKAIRRRQHDLVSDEGGKRDSGVQLVYTDFPPAADDSAYRIVQPGRSPTDLDLLAPGQPELRAHQSVLEHNEKILELFVEKRRAREAQRHANDLGVVTI